MSIKICAGCKQGTTRIPAGVQFFGAIIKTRDLLQEKCFNRYFNIAFRGNAHILYCKKKKSRAKKWLSIKAFQHDKDNFIKSVRELGTEDIVPHFGLLTSCLSLWSHPRWFLLVEKNISPENKVEISVEKRGFPLQEKWIPFVASFALSFPVYCFAPPLTSQPRWDSCRRFT